MQISYRLFELTNTLKVAFVPSKDDKRLAYNAITAVVILTVLYTLSFVFLKLPLMLVRFLTIYIIKFSFLTLLGIIHQLNRDALSMLYCISPLLQVIVVTDFHAINPTFFCYILPSISELKFQK